jgi:hypothetical protein
MNGQWEFICNTLDVTLLPHFEGTARLFDPHSVTVTPLDDTDTWLPDALESAFYEVGVSAGSLLV